LTAVRAPATVGAIPIAIAVTEIRMKYLCLAYEEEGKLNELSASDWQALRQETLDYVGGLRDSGRLVIAQALRSASTASTVRVRGGTLSVTDGPFAETKEQLGGFFLIEAGSVEEAIQVAAQWPSARIGSIEVRPIEEELPMDRRY
jgi:hypothetical protein